MLRIYTLILVVFISFASHGQEEVLDAQELLRKAGNASSDVSVESLIKKSKDFDLGEYNIDALRDVINSKIAKQDEISEVIDGFGDVLRKDNNASSMNPIQSASGIANLEAATEREEVLNFLGISELKNHLYVFVSYSMPEDMIKAYAREAMWSGASLVVKGLLEGEEISDFVQKKAKALLNGKGYTAAMHIDPRLFDAFEINSVPAIVLSKDDVSQYCVSSAVKVNEKNATPLCVSRKSDTYVKVSGAITLDYALKLFMESESFSDEANSRLDALRSNIGKPDKNEQVDKYNFKDDLSPHQKKLLKEHYSQFGEVVDTELGLSVKPFEPPSRVGVSFKRHKNKK
jgi:conjugal transfer pilus assembly protein TrbC